MKSWPQARPEPREPDPNQKRRTGRISPDCITCDLGKVLDLSGGGVRLGGRGPSPGRVGQPVKLTLDWGMGSLVFEGVVTRLERKALFGWTAGIRFENLTPAHKQALSKASMLAASGEITDWCRAG
ncbi:MAG: PilZ domain-containing protein [Phycisphaerales bacterium]|jgi:hypothetical protein